MRRTVVGLMLNCALFQVAGAITIDFDYTYDNGFFGGHPERQHVLNTAGAFFEANLVDTLDPIVTVGANHFDEKFIRPDTGEITVLKDQSVAADTLTVYVGGRDLRDPKYPFKQVLGVGGPGISLYRIPPGAHDPAFLAAVRGRGEPGVTVDLASRTDFGPWGGQITFSTIANWYFDPDPVTTEAFPGQSDFYTVALHELGHVLGFGLADSWRNLLAPSNVFTGPHAVAVYGGDVPVTLDGGHWASGILGGLGRQPPEAAMDPDISIGSRKRFTNLDMAGLQDIGWEVTSVPIPPAGLLLATGLVGLLMVGWRRVDGREHKATEQQRWRKEAGGSCGCSYFISCH